MREGMATDESYDMLTIELIMKISAAYITSTLSAIPYK